MNKSKPLSKRSKSDKIYYVAFPQSNAPTKWENQHNKSFFNNKKLSRITVKTLSVLTKSEKPLTFAQIEARVYGFNVLSKMKAHTTHVRRVLQKLLWKMPHRFEISKNKSGSVAIRLVRVA